MAWSLPLYELALTFAGHAYDMNFELEVTILTSEDSPLAIFGQDASRAAQGCLIVQRSRRSPPPMPKSPAPGRSSSTSATGVRMIAQPELYGPSVRGIPSSKLVIVHACRPLHTLPPPLS
jgi:hypothetical protein